MQQLITIGLSIVGSFLMVLCLAPSASYEFFMLAKVAGAILFFQIGIVLHNKLFGKAAEKRKQISDEIQKFENRVMYIHI